MQLQRKTHVFLLCNQQDTVYDAGVLIVVAVVSGVVDVVVAAVAIASFSATKLHTLSDTSTMDRPTHEAATTMIKIRQEKTRTRTITATAIATAVATTAASTALQQQQQQPQQQHQ